MDKTRRSEGRRFSDEERMLMYRRVLEGRSYPDIAAEFDSCLNAIYRVFGARRDRAVVRRRSALRLSLEEREEISRGSTQGADPEHTVEANAKRGAKVAEEAAARAAWESTNARSPDSETYASKIAPNLARYSVRVIRAATGLSLRYCALIRKGERVPYARHWPNLLRLVAET